MARDENPFNDPPARPTPKSRSQTAKTEAIKDSMPAGRRSQSTDSVPAVTEKPRSKGRGKKGSQHADVIDRLDFTGVGPMFHHDGPFDACAPSRNRQRNKAPMLAWSGNPADAPPPATQDPYPSPNAYTPYTETAPRKKVDAIAEAWGIHEPEPYEEFFAGGGNNGTTPTNSIYNGKEKEKESRSRSRAARQTSRRSAVPPPQPIFASDSLDADEPIMSGQGSPGGGPKRSKSLMQKIRKMRDSPNVPPSSYGDQPPPSPPLEEEQYASSRPTHRSQNSLIGRFSKDGSRPSVPAAGEKPDSYVYIEPHSPNKKDLPTTPNGNSYNDGYFDARSGSNTPGATPGGGMGRKTSIMKKMGRVVRGTK